MLKKIAIALLFVVLPACAFASGVTAVGPRAGFSSGPSQLVLGGHLSIGDIAPHIVFVPSAELGLGDDRTIVTINGDMHYEFSVNGSDWRPYAGAGVGIHFISRDNPAPASDDSDTDVAGAIIVGAMVPNRSNEFFTELKLGFGHPDLKLMVGWNFGR